ncbi:MAG TPA: hypothetical protein VEU53_06780 [Stellaceae bacterium]|nr:hypothetical protein [Stellaceae bacterium]
MFVKSDDLRRSLWEIDHLLHSLRANAVGDTIDLDEIDVLESSRRTIVNMLEARRLQNSEPIVHLQAWCDGNLADLPMAADRSAVVSQATHPQPGQPRLHCVS